MPDMDRSPHVLESTPRSPLGAVLGELRSAPATGRARTARTRVARTATTPGPEPDLRLETRVASDRRPSGALAVRWLLPASLFAHAALLSGAVFGPLLRADALPPAAPAARAFFATPAMLAAPAPPPPSPPAVAKAPARAPRPVAPAPTLVAPVEVPAAIAPESVAVAISPQEAGAEEAGIDGGVAGGVSGGVVGGIIGTPEAPAAPLEPIRVGGGVREPAKLKHVPPVYPDIAVRANVQGNVVLECTVSPLGRVTRVTVVKSIPLLDQAAMEAVKQWVYTPTLKDGVPVPVILTVTVQFGLKSA
jgi:periplasmic protein TonB